MGSLYPPTAEGEAVPEYCRHSPKPREFEAEAIAIASGNHGLPEIQEKVNADGRICTHNIRHLQDDERTAQTHHCRPAAAKKTVELAGCEKFEAGAKGRLYKTFAVERALQKTIRCSAAPDRTEEERNAVETANRAPFETRREVIGSGGACAPSPEVVERRQAKYLEAYEKLMGKRL